MHAEKYAVKIRKTKMQAARLFETSLIFYQTTCHYVTENIKASHSCEDFIFHETSKAADNSQQFYLIRPRDTIETC